MKMSVEEYLEDIKQRKSKQTLKEYRHGISKFSEWFGKSPNEILAVRKEDLQSDEKQVRERFLRELEKFHKHLLDKEISFSSNRTLDGVTVFPSSTSLGTNGLCSLGTVIESVACPSKSSTLTSPMPSEDSVAICSAAPNILTSKSPMSDGIVISSISFVFANSSSVFNFFYLILYLKPKARTEQ